MRRIGTMFATGLLCSALVLAACGGSDDEGSCTATAATEAAACSDGIDNDCDGQIDSQDSDCACTATATSESGATCSDGIDNDCDGAADGADSDCACTPVAIPETNCSDGVDDDCDGLIDDADSDCSCASTPEICDGVDNNCDGTTDEGLTRDCTANGQTGTETCDGGEWGDCVVETVPTEICNGQDDDNDGDVDENLQRACSTACGAGIETCIGGEWANCDAPQPQAEICDERDNDCNGQIDDDLTRMCETICGQGRETCSLGNWVGCDAPRPVTETCDNVDNDCDGLTDEELSKSCTTDCGDGAQTCTAGQWGACSAPEPAAEETCGDGIDNDCNGDIDDGCTTTGCEPGTQANCRGVDNQGLCQDGVRTCGSDREFGPCQLGPLNLADPGTETCNGRDDDCDGGTDETFPDMDMACGGGPNSSPLDEGECVSGVWACDGGQVVCEGMVAPTDEICNGLDDDCDGSTDNELGGDQWETNETCATAETRWVGSEDLVVQGGATRFITGTVYPEGDTDMYIVKIEEEENWCLIPALNDPDTPYEFTVDLYNIPEGVDYDLCITAEFEEYVPVISDRLSIDDFCETPDPILERTCVTESVDGSKSITLEVTSADCGFSENMLVLIEVLPVGETDSSCEPYTVSVEASTLPFE